MSLTARSPKRLMPHAEPTDLGQRSEPCSASPSKRHNASTAGIWVWPNRCVPFFPLAARVLPASTSEQACVELLLGDLVASGQSDRLELVLVDRGNLTERCPSTVGQVRSRGAPGRLGPTSARRAWPKGVPTDSTCLAGRGRTRPAGQVPPSRQELREHRQLGDRLAAIRVHRRSARCRGLKPRAQTDHQCLAAHIDGEQRSQANRKYRTVGAYSVRMALRKRSERDSH